MFLGEDYKDGGGYVLFILQFQSLLEFFVMIASCVLTTRHLRGATKYTDVSLFHTAHATFSVLTFSTSMWLSFGPLDLEMTSCRGIAILALYFIPPKLLLIGASVVFFQHW
jgi:hypothetical protein